jgi:hypothetical protein
MAGIVNIEIEGQSYGVAPYKIAELRKVAPHVDRMNVLGREAKQRREDQQKLKEEGKDREAEALNPTFASAMEMLHETIAILAVGLEKIEPNFTADYLETIWDPTYLGSLQEAAFAVLKGSGLTRGEATALSSPAKPEEGAEQASLSSSEESSAS